MVRFRINDGRPVADVIRDMERQKIGTAQPNYVFKTQEDVHALLAPLRSDPRQYVVSKLGLIAAHRISTGKNVLVAIIDSQVDTVHPDLVGAFADEFDAAGAQDKPDPHGTAVTGAIVAHKNLLGVAPSARILAIHAFSPERKSSAEATSDHVIAGIDRAILKGARIINMSFAGPYDPMLQLALKKAHDKGIVLIAAVGNSGPQSPPLYPAADENVIAVTAVDSNDNLLPQAVQGPHVAVAAPGVDILEPAPDAGYQMVSGTSIAAAHISGVAALLIERSPQLDSMALEKTLTSTAKDLGSKGRDNQFGYGLVNPYLALKALDLQITTGLEKNRPAILPVGTAKPLPRPAPMQNTSTLPVFTTGRSVVSQLAPAPAQTSPPQPPRPQESAPRELEGESDGARAAIEAKRQACRQDGNQKGIRGPDLQDHVVICVAEARLNCLKQAIAQKLRGPERSEFIRACLNR